MRVLWAFKRYPFDWLSHIQKLKEIDHNIHALVAHFFNTLILLMEINSILVVLYIASCKSNKYTKFTLKSIISMYSFTICYTQHWNINSSYHYLSPSFWSVLLIVCHSYQTNSHRWCFHILYYSFCESKFYILFQVYHIISCRLNLWSNWVISGGEFRWWMK